MDLKAFFRKRFPYKHYRSKPKGWLVRSSKQDRVFLDLQDAIDYCNPGGSIFGYEGTYVRNNKIIKPTHIDIYGTGYGTELKCSEADWVIEITTNYEEWLKTGRIADMRLTGISSNLGGIRIVDAFKTEVKNVCLSGFTTGDTIRIENVEHWTEGWTLSNIQIRNSLKGVAFKKTGGTSSMGYAGMMNTVHIGLDVENAIGIDVAQNCHVLRCCLLGIIVWLTKDTHKGLYIDGEFSDNILDLTVENQNANAEVGSGIELGSHAWAGRNKLIGFRTIAGPSGYDVARPLHNPYTRIFDMVFDREFAIRDTRLWLQRTKLIADETGTTDTDKELIQFRQRVGSGATSSLTSNATSGQKIVNVTNGALFSTKDRVVIQDDNNEEYNYIDSIDGNQLTMHWNLSFTYTVAANGKVKQDYEPIVNVNLYDRILELLRDGKIKIYSDAWWATPTVRINEPSGEIWSKSTIATDWEMRCWSAGKGLIVKTPDGSKNYRIRVDNAGNIVTEEI